MNRLILIGNGFDIAHDIKSSFKDFIKDYFCKAINSFYEEGVYADQLFEIKFKNHFDQVKAPDNPITPESALDQTRIFLANPKLSTKFHSSLLELAFKKINELNWVDLEVEFFTLLSLTNTRYKDPERKKVIEQINIELEFFKSKLIEYLQNLEEKFSNNFDKEPFINCFCEDIKKDEIVTVHLEEDKLPDNLYFLNFNYTKTFQTYFDECKKRIPSDYNFIHGCLEGVNGNPIFGFGDELNKKYLEFEHEKDNQLFKHIKSFEYLQTKNFYLLTRFIESSDFQVHIYGHSCGLSDRTMLNQIFMHDNCKSIKVFYYKIDEENNDFTNKTYAISRHFEDKTMLRKKLVPLELSTPMPQPTH
jgi:hypothetical protein